jgi:hypothetical protein
MSITGMPLILLAVAVTLAAVAATVLTWQRFGRWRLLTRPVGILVCQSLILLAVGLVVNRSEQFYPSWAALSGKQEAETVAPVEPEGRLDDALRARAVPGSSSATRVPWQPTGWATWQLGGIPTVAVPPDYLSRATTAFPTVLSIMAGPVTSTARPARTTPPSGSPSPSTSAGPAPRSAPGPDTASPAAAAVLVIAPASDRTTAAVVATTLPDRLGRDLRVTPRGWSLVAGVRQAALAAEAVRLGAGRFTSLVLIADDASTVLPPEVRLPTDVAVAVVRPGPIASGATATPPGGTGGHGSSSPSHPTGTHPPRAPGKHAAPGTAVGGSATTVTAPGTTGQGAPVGGGTVPNGTAQPPVDRAAVVPAVRLSCPSGAEWSTAVAWAVRQTPPALAPPVVLPSISAKPAGW